MEGEVIFWWWKGSDVDFGRGLAGKCRDGECDLFA